ncbi:hypothetical protein R1flu_019448 [Riccia fluitans]|uniref:Uncharacterized protein n=1 Tax=Riccia fluitans TaxID=41844 RepID=A0ABD1ZK54_9MARC
MKHSTRAFPNKCVGHQHLKNPNLRDCGYNERVDRKETSLKTAALDQERYEVACLRQDIIDEYEKKSAELLEYLNSMEMAFNNQRHEYEDREAQLLAENKELKNELKGGCTTHLEEQKAQEREKREWENQRAINQLKEECRRTEKILKKTQRSVQELEEEVYNLQDELQRKDDLLYHKTKTMEKGRKKLELENANLKRKAALGWMVGCLSELFFRLDPELGVGTVLKLVRKVQKELEYGNNVFDCHMGQGPKVEYDIIQKEIRRLLGRSSQRVSPSCCLLRDERGQNEHSDIRRKRICKGGRHSRPHSAPDLTLKAAADELEREAALERVACDSSRSASVPETPRTAPCLAIDTRGENCPTASCHSSPPAKLMREQRSSQHTPPSSTPAHHYLVQVNRRQSLRKRLRHLEASMMFILGQERRRRKTEGRTSLNKPVRRGIICCKHQDSTILQ